MFTGVQVTISLDMVHHGMPATVMFRNGMAFDHGSPKTDRCEQVVCVVRRLIFGLLQLGHVLRFKKDVCACV